MKKNLKTTLEAFYRGFDFDGRIKEDPIEFPLGYKNPLDAEAAGFIASAFAYGRVGLFKPVVAGILDVMGESPHGYLVEFNLKKERSRLAGIRYRFQDGDDVVCFVYILSVILKKYGSLEGLFMHYYNKDDANTGRALGGAMDELRSTGTKAVYGSDIKPQGLLHLMPSPTAGSASKRACLFMRWMVRDRDIDLGLWKGIPADRLVIPLDTHISRVSRCLGLTRRRDAGWKTAVEITESLKKLDPLDPLKYDFALCHHGISGVCSRPGSDEGCSGCALKEVRA